MRIDVRGHEIAVTREIRNHVERRLQFALGRFGRHVRRVTVRLSDVNGPRGGADKTCRIAVAMPRHQGMVVEDADASLYVAVDRAAERAGRMVTRYLTRIRDSHRTPAAELVAGDL